MAAVLRVTNLRQSFNRMAMGARKAAEELPPAMTRAMADEFSRVLIRGSKRKSRPRTTRFMPNREGTGTVMAGWYGRDYGAAERYTDRARDAAAKRGFRRGARKASRRFAAIRL